MKIENVKKKFEDIAGVTHMSDNIYKKKLNVHRTFREKMTRNKILSTFN